MKTRITELFGIEYPIIQGAMQWLSKAPLAIAVSKAGGLGTINMSSYPDAEDLRADIRKIRAATDKPFAVNVFRLPGMSVDGHLRKILEVINEENVGIVETAGSNPRDIIPLLRRNPDIKIFHKAPGLRFLQSAEREGVDAVVMLGTEGGGLPGSDFVSSSILWPKAAETLHIPVIAAGGICDSRSFAAALACGCEGVTVGTRFFMAEECPIGPRIKSRLIEAQEMDTVLTQTSIHNPCRCIKNKPSLEIVEYENREHPTFEQLYPRIRGTLVKAAYEADEFDQSYFSIGEAIGRISSVETVADIIREMVEGYEKIVAHMSTIVQS